MLEAKRLLGWRCGRTDAMTSARRLLDHVTAVHPTGRVVWIFRMILLYIMREVVHSTCIVS